MLTWIYEFRPGNKTIYAVFDEESEFSGPRTPTLSPDQVSEANVPYKTLRFNMIFSLLVSQSVQGVIALLRADVQNDAGHLSDGDKTRVAEQLADFVDFCEACCQTFPDGKSGPSPRGGPPPKKRDE